MLNLALTELLTEALRAVPQLQQAGLDAALLRVNALRDQTIVVKYGGNAMTDEVLQAQFAYDVALLNAMGVHVVVVHGGGPQIDHMLERVGKTGEFIQGMRVTDVETMTIVEGVLAGNVQGQVVNLINHAGRSYGVRAVGVSGRDGRMIRVKKLLLTDAQNPAVQHDIGQVGEVVAVDTALIDALLAADFVPVISPISADEHDVTHNVNADVIASEVACALKAAKLMLLTNIKGVLDKQGELIPALNAPQIDGLVSDGTLYGGMLPKIASALDAAQRGVAAVHIADGRVAHGLLLALLSDAAVGTSITA
ncbi:MAG: acetylglutamate kinase [Formosimonas sp.]